MPRLPAQKSLAFIATLAGRDLETKTDSAGEFHVTRELHRTVLCARCSDGKRKGVVEIGPDEQRVMIRMQPVASAVGRLVDAESKQPLAGKQLRFGVDVPIGDDDAPWKTAFGNTVVTDSEGKFILEGLVPGQEYGIDVFLDDGHRSRQVAELTPEPAARINLGDVELPRPAPPYKRATLQERVASAFSVESIHERIANGKRDARVGCLRLLVVFADAESEATQKLYKLATKTMTSGRF